MTETAPLIPYEQMLQAGMHFGRKRTVFNPSMESCVFSVRDGICIIDLLKTQEALASAIAFLNETLQAGGLVLFVAPTKQSQEAVRELAEAANMPYVMDRWLGGTLTNFKNINGRVKRLVQLEEDKAAGRWEKYTKKEQLELDREVADMRKKFDGLKKLVRMPDLVFVASLKEGALAVHEARAMNVGVIAIANTDADPRGVAHMVCANDRSKKSVDLLVGAMRENLNTTVDMSDVNVIKEPSEETGLSFDKIKKALDDAGGDRAKAVALLAAAAGDAAAKKADRVAKDGAIGSYVHSTGKIGAMVQLACETDFVARNDSFKPLARDLAMHASAMRPAGADEMLGQPFVKDPSVTVRDVLDQAIQKLGENIKLAGVSVLTID